MRQDDRAEFISASLRLLRQLCAVEGRALIHCSEEARYGQDAQDHKADDCLGHEVAGIEHEGVEIGRRVGRCIRAEEDNAGDVVAEEASREGERCTCIEPPRNDCGKRKRHVRQRIVKDHLQGMKDECVLHEVYHTVEEPCKTADTCAVAIGEKEQRHHCSERDAAALRHVKEPQLMENNGQRQHQRDIDEHTRREPDAAHLQIAKDEDEYGEQCEETRRLCEQLGSALNNSVHGDLLDERMTISYVALAYYKYDVNSIPSAVSILSRLYDKCYGDTLRSM